MGNREIIKKLAKRMYGNAKEIEMKQCAEFCNTLVDIITEALLNNEKILWKGFISMEVIERAERKGRNPSTNELVTFPPVKSVNCRISKAIKDAVNGKKCE